LLDSRGRIRSIGVAEKLRAMRGNYLSLDFSGREFVRKARESKTAVWSNTYLSAVTGRPAVARVEFFDDYLLVGEVALSPLADLAAQSVEGDVLSVMLLDGVDQLVAHSANRFSGQQLNLADLEAVKLARSGDFSRQSEMRFDNRQMVGTALPVAKTSWLALVVQSKEDANRSIDAVWVRLYLSFAMAVFAAGIAAFWTARGLTRRFQDYVRHADAIAAGRYPAKLARTSVREFNHLADSLDRMDGAIRSREDAMQLAEAALRRSREQLLATINQTPNVAVQWYDASGRVVMWNLASETVLGVSPAEAIGKTLDQLIYTEAQTRDFVAMLAKLGNSGFIGPYESSCQRADGSVRYLICTTFVIPGDGATPFYVCMDVDVTEQKLAEQALHELNLTLEARVDERTDELSRANDELVETLETLKNAQGELVRSEKLASLGSMVAGVAHELNTPIGNSVMVATTLEQRCHEFLTEVEQGTIRRSVLDRFVRESVSATEMLSRNLHLASELISSFKQVAVDQTSSHRRRFAIDEVVGENLLALQPMLKQTPYQVTTEIAPDLWLDSYPGPFGQVLVNLINNAVLHGFDGRDHGQINIFAAPAEAGWVKLTLSDNGRGIPLANQGKIFDPFFTTRLGQGGSGLGLHIVYNLVINVLGGKMDVCSAPDAGCVFTLYLPTNAPVGNVADNV
jgi:PAS domain S-box-containing protein